MTETMRIATPDGESLEGEITHPDGPARATCVLCHPHPQHGGSMRSLVISELFRALPAAGVTTMRFNFRGVEGSTGTWSAGAGERADAVAAVAVAANLESARPFVLTGWSFGADMALATLDERVTGWFAIAPPLRSTTDADLDAIGSDPRPKLLALGEHDEVRPAEEVTAVAAEWVDTEVVIVPGASHFFVGRTDRLVALALGFVERIVAATG